MAKAKKLNVDKTFKFLFDFALEEGEIENYDERAYFLREFFSNLKDGFIDEEYSELLKKNKIKLKELLEDNGNYHDSVNYEVVVEVNKILYHFNIYDNGLIGADAVSYDKTMTEVVKKKISKTVYLNKK